MKPNRGDVCLITGTTWIEPYGLFLRLDGYPHDLVFIAAAFRPLTSRTQEEDLAIFRPLLETAGEDA